MSMMQEEIEFAPADAPAGSTGKADKQKVVLETTGAEVSGKADKYELVPETRGADATGKADKEKNTRGRIRGEHVGTDATGKANVENTGGRVRGQHLARKRAQRARIATPKPTHIPTFFPTENNNGFDYIEGTLIPTFSPTNFPTEFSMRESFQMIVRSLITETSSRGLYSLQFLELGADVAISRNNYESVSGKSNKLEVRDSFRNNYGAVSGKSDKPGMTPREWLRDNDRDSTVNEYAGTQRGFTGKSDKPEAMSREWMMHEVESYEVAGKARKRMRQ
jgi:hypothetical protein